MQCVVDVDFMGSSGSQLGHLMNRHNKAQLNFELNLRGYRDKSNSPFKADAPWQFPAIKNFSPENTLKDMSERVKASNFAPFKDKFNVSDVNSMLHTFEPSTSVYGNAEWFTDLRGDRKLVKNTSRKIIKSPKRGSP